MTWTEMRKKNPKAFWELVFEGAVALGMVLWTIALIIFA